MRSIYRLITVRACDHLFFFSLTIDVSLVSVFVRALPLGAQANLHLYRQNATRSRRQKNAGLVLWTRR
jgi:hypothetical protein